MLHKGVMFVLVQHAGSKVQHAGLLYTARWFMMYSTLVSHVQHAVHSDQ
jgi:hypothetical protein